MIDNCSFLLVHGQEECTHPMAPILPAFLWTCEWFRQGVVECLDKCIRVLHYILITQIIYANNPSKIVPTSVVGQCDGIKWALTSWTRKCQGIFSNFAAQEVTWKGIYEIKRKKDSKRLYWVWAHGSGAGGVGGWGGSSCVKFNSWSNKSTFIILPWLVLGIVTTLRSSVTFQFDWWVFSHCTTCISLCLSLCISVFHLGRAGWKILTLKNKINSAVSLSLILNIGRPCTLETLSTHDPFSCTNSCQQQNCCSLHQSGITKMSLPSWPHTPPPWQTKAFNV